MEEGGAEESDESGLGARGGGEWCGCEYKMRVIIVVQVSELS